ncbi:MAG: calcium-binding EGF-like domain-containing protein [Gammaproteobacteria bacterium]|nr:calcium-binding EGF-like domain-containing protein [Gammaproteobacteria bacterium]
MSDIDECRSNPCKHGECVDKVSRYECNCSGTGFTGKECEKGKMNE